MHGEGGRRRQVQLLDLLPDIPGDTRDGGVPCRHDALSCLAALHAALAEPFVLGKSTNLLDVPLDISGNALTVSTHPALEIDTMVGMADATDALSDSARVAERGARAHDWPLRVPARRAPGARGLLGAGPDRAVAGASSALCW